MILEKDFYFVRHGQTDYNLSGKDKEHHPEETPLNETGRAQAIAIEPVVAILPIQRICASPLKRVQETKSLVANRLQVPHHDIDDLRECTIGTWNEMAAHGMFSSIPENGEARQFMDRIRNGVNHALSLPGTSLIIAHGGVHWAICCLLGIDTHEWLIHNCGLVHFYHKNGKWNASKINDFCAHSN